MSRRPVLIIVAGPNGSGKTTITKSLLAHQWAEDCVYVNPDDIANDLFGDWNSKESSLKAAVHAEKIRGDCITNGKSLIFETVMSVRDKLDFVRHAKESGYFVRLFFICTSTPKINASRVAGRVMEGGHDVPIQKIIDRYSKSIANCADIIDEVDRAYIFDNSAENQNPVLLYRVSDGEIVKNYEKSIPDWADLIKSDLPDPPPSPGRRCAM